MKCKAVADFYKLIEVVELFEWASTLRAAPFGPDGELIRDEINARIERGEERLAPIEDLAWRLAEHEVVPTQALAVLLSHYFGKSLSNEKASEWRGGGDIRRDNHEPQLAKLEIALAILVNHPEWSDTRIAEAVGVHRTTLYKRSWIKFQAAREAIRSRKFDRPYGNNGEDFRSLDKP